MYRRFSMTRINTCDPARRFAAGGELAAAKDSQ
jgi:hypothetical protein